MGYLQHPVTEDRPVRIGLIGAGWIGTFHAESVAHRIPPMPGLKQSRILPFRPSRNSPAAWRCQDQ